MDELITCPVELFAKELHVWNPRQAVALPVELAQLRMRQQQTRKNNEKYQRAKDLGKSIRASARTRRDEIYWPKYQISNYKFE